MYEELTTSLARISKMPTEESQQYFADVLRKSRNDLVVTEWRVFYERTGRDMHSIADVSLAHKGDALLQVWLRNAAAGFWIPEIQPWEISVVEFAPELSIPKAKLGLMDSKWTDEDVGRKYHYQFWGYLLHDGNVESFAFEKWATFPGDPPD